MSTKPIEIKGLKERLDAAKKALGRARGGLSLVEVTATGLADGCTDLHKQLSAAHADLGFEASQLGNSSEELLKQLAGE